MGSRGRSGVLVPCDWVFVCVSSCLLVSCVCGVLERYYGGKGYLPSDTLDRFQVSKLYAVFTVDR